MSGSAAEPVSVSVIFAINETTASMSTEAGKKALESAGVKAEDLDLIIVATMYTGYAGSKYGMSGTE